MQNENARKSAGRVLELVRAKVKVFIYRSPAVGLVIIINEYNMRKIYF